VVVVVMFFGLMYQPFLLARAGVNTESIEQRSISDRIVYNQIALDIIEGSPIIGIGAANYQWYAARYLAGTDMDLQGQPVHNIYLLLWTELGLVGLLLFGGILLLGVLLIVRNIRRGKHLTLAQTSYLSVAALVLAVGWLDHYPLTLLMFRTFWLGLFAMAVFPANQDDAGA
jgi:O-antigen ligase